MLSWRWARNLSIWPRRSSRHHQTSEMTQPAGPGKWSFPFNQLWWGCTLSSVLCSSIRERLRGLEECPKKGNKTGEGLEHKSYDEQLRELGLFNLEKRWVSTTTWKVASDRWEVTALSYVRVSSCWVLGKYISQKEWSGTETGCPGKW